MAGLLRGPGIRPGVETRWLPVCLCPAGAHRRPCPGQRARHSACGRRGQDARLPCRRVVAPAQQMDLSIVILNYNTRDHLSACLESVREGLAEAHVEAEVIVVDNASTD